MLEQTLIEEPILQYPYPNKAYTLFTNASEHDWACDLAKSFEFAVECKKVVMQHPIAYQSGSCKGS